MIAAVLPSIQDQFAHTKRWLRNRLRPGALILMYHRVAEVDSDPWSLCVHPNHFVQHLDVLQQYCEPIRLSQLPLMLQNRTPLKRQVIITFDDGYADNFNIAKPLLERHNIPATIFVVSGKIDQSQEFWWDELDRILLQPGTLPPTLSLKFDGQCHEWSLNQAAAYSTEDYEMYRSWSALGKDAPSDRHRLYRQLYERLHPLRLEVREAVLDQLRQWAGMTPLGRSSHRTVSTAELTALRHHKLIEIGAHTLTHPFLSILPVDQQEIEIQQSKAHLEDCLGQPVTSFSYPHGSYTEETVSMVRRAGFECACSSLVSPVYQCSDRFLLPRVEVQNWNGKQFAKWLSSWIGK